jgi:hypothetical protein
VAESCKPRCVFAYATRPLCVGATHGAGRSPGTVVLFIVCNEGHGPQCRLSQMFEFKKRKRVIRTWTMKTFEARTRIEVRNIPFATNFSPAATSARPYAAGLAKRFGAKLYALHVMTPIVNLRTEPVTWAVIERGTCR